MATPIGALRRIRVARRRAASSRGKFEEYQADYEAALTEIKRLCDDEAMEDLTEWIIVETTEAGELPSPDAVVERARSMCIARDRTIPDDSAIG